MNVSFIKVIQKGIILQLSVSEILNDQANILYLLNTSFVQLFLLYIQNFLGNTHFLISGQNYICKKNYFSLKRNNFQWLLSF